MASCDPCAAQPLNTTELQQAGVFWLNPFNRDVFITRLHVRYTRDKFPEDLVFQETSNREQFQGRYILRHPFKGEPTCPTAKQYRQELNQRLNKEAQTLAQLTGWNLEDIKRKAPQIQSLNLSWWQQFWDFTR
jgi:hypothetical protein